MANYCSIIPVTPSYLEHLQTAHFSLRSLRADNYSDHSAVFRAQDKKGVLRIIQR